jgi:hypothetical protein
MGLAKKPNHTNIAHQRETSPPSDKRARPPKGLTKTPKKTSRKHHTEPF